MCGWRACGLWATRVGGTGVGAIALGSARSCASEGAQMHASGCGIRHGLSGEGASGVWVSAIGLVRRAERLSLRRVVVLVSAVQKAWSKEVFLVGSSGLCAWTVCNIFYLF